jgi:hypothetical protein
VVACDLCDPVTISAKNRLCLQPVITYGISCVCAELGGSGTPAGDRGGNVEPRVAATWMQGRSTQHATDAQTGCSLRSVHMVHEGTYCDAESSRAATAISGFMAWSWLRLVSVATTQLRCHFLHHDTTREYAFATYMLLLWHGCRSADVGVPSQWLWTSGRL